MCFSISHSLLWNKYTELFLCNELHQLQYLPNEKELLKDYRNGHSRVIDWTVMILCLLALVMYWYAMHLFISHSYTYKYSLSTADITDPCNTPNSQVLLGDKEKIHIIFLWLGNTDNVAACFLQSKMFLNYTPVNK